MGRVPRKRICFIGCLLAVAVTVNWCQGQFPSSAESRVSRQAESLRLDKRIDRLEARVKQLERKLAERSGGESNQSSIAVSKANVTLAESKLASTETAVANGQANEHELAVAKHAVEVAKLQLEEAIAAHGDRELVLETEVEYARATLADVQVQQQQLERLIGRSLSSTEGIRRKDKEVEIAKKQLLRAIERLERHRKQNPENE